MVYLKSVENVITFGKLIGLLFLFCIPLLSILFLKTPKIRGMSTLAQYNGNHFSSNDIVMSVHGSSLPQSGMLP